MPEISGYRLLMVRFINMMHEMIVLLITRFLPKKKYLLLFILVNMLDAGTYGLIISTDIGGLKTI